jgi:hypothetical protein
LGGVFPDLVGADADAVEGVDDDEGEVADAQGAEAFADEIEVTRGIDDVELLVEPFGMEEGGVDGDLAVFFVGVIIGEGGAGGDAAEAVDDAGKRACTSLSMVLPAEAWPTIAKLRMSFVVSQAGPGRHVEKPGCEGACWRGALTWAWGCR